MIPKNHVCFFIEKFEDTIDLSDIDFKYKYNPSQKAYPATMHVHVILLNTIYSIHSNRELKHIIRENIAFIYCFQQPDLSTIPAFKREKGNTRKKYFLKQLINIKIIKIFKKNKPFL